MSIFILFFRTKNCVPSPYNLKHFRNETMKKINTDFIENVEFHSLSILNMNHEYLSITGNDNWFIDEIGNLVYKINNEGKFSKMLFSLKNAYCLYFYES